jgi:spore maturation protein CgeB
MTPTKDQINLGVAEAKSLMSQYAPSFIANMITDDQITQGVTAILVAALKNTKE